MDSETGHNVKSDHDGDKTFKFTPQRGGSLLATRRRTLHSGCKKVNSSFKSPVQVSSTLNNGVCVEEEVKELQNTLLKLESDIKLLENEGVCVHELDLHINLLHEYNDIKDIAQTLLGRLAGLRSVTTRDLYARFGMELDD
ncbi:DNA repair protein SWI5 homolog [Tachysurus fulvidraco]|uniref:DNA repair protein SWI5 homolog n=1 Tax=Tachysurus fulvidraco TaxID=1234273 RepID=UPI000F4F3C59|nr:DNA repair protein SWI5 homolog [Tachysurus fulvidraco]